MSARMDGQGQPHRRMEPQGRAVGYFHGQHQADHHMANNNDGEIGRRVVGALMMQRLAAMGAIVRDLQKAVEQGANTAGRAFEPGAAP